MHHPARRSGFAVVTILIVAATTVFASKAMKLAVSQWQAAAASLAEQRAAVDAALDER